MAQKMKKRADGRYLINVQVGWKPDGSRKYKSVYGATQAEVLAAAEEIKTKWKNGSFLEKDNLGTSGWIETWLETYKSEVSDSTYKMYETAARIHVTPSVGSAKLKSVRNHHLQSILTKMAESHSKHTVEIVKLTICQIFRTAHQNGLIERDPSIGLVARGHAAENRRALKEDEQKIFLSACFGKMEWMYPVFLYYTGLRRGEALALTVSDIDLMGKTVTVNKTVKFKSNQPYIGPPKSKAAYRSVPLPPPLFSMLSTYMCGLSGLVLFPMKDGRLTTLSSFRKMWARLQKTLNSEAGGNSNLQAFSPVVPHMLRHTYATRLYDLDVDVKTAQRWLGHEDPMVTMKIYTHLSEERQNKSTEKLASWDAPSIRETV